MRRAPVLRPAPDLVVPLAALRPVCALLSDTHVVAPGRTPSELELDPGQWPWAEPPTADDLRGGVARVLAHVARHAPPRVVWCGDEVDTGDPAEWHALAELLRATPALSHRMVPGNHDLCFNRPYDADPDLVRRARREAAFEAHAGALGAFPRAEVVEGPAGPATVVLLDSCRHRSRHVLSNAIGRFGPAQLARLARVLAAVEGPLLCVAHHHVWRDAPFANPEEWFNTAADADRLAALLCAYRRRGPRNHVLACHGHRHALTAGVFGAPAAPVAVIGLPSTTLGDKAVTGQLDGILRYAVAGLRDDGAWGIALREVGALRGGRRRAGLARPSLPPGPSLRALAVRGPRAR